LISKYNFEEDNLESANILDYLLAVKNLNVNYQDALGNTALHYAISTSIRRAEALLARKDIDPNKQNTLGHTPLHLTVDEDIRQLLVQKGADQSIQDKQGRTPHDYYNLMKKLPYRSHIGNVIGSMYQQIHESDQPIYSKIPYATLCTLVQPVRFPFLALEDAFDSITHSTSGHGV